MVVTLRPAGPDDAPFLTEMLVAAAYWRPDGPSGSTGDVPGDPALARYVAGWPRAGDLGVVAEDGHPVGAAWLRFLPEDDPGYGFVDARTPELTIAVQRSWRGQGVGGRLVAALVDEARREGIAGLSLSVERDNDARRLYERAGFEAVGTSGGAVTMYLRL